MKFGAPLEIRLPLLVEDRAVCVEDRALGVADAVGSRLDALDEVRAGSAARRRSSVATIVSSRRMTTTSVPLLRLVKILSNDVLIVSVKTYVPGDQRHAERDGQRGQGEAQLAGEQPAERDLAHQLGVAARSRPSDDRPFVSTIRRSRVGGGVLVVGDHDDRLAELVDRAAQQPQDLGRGLGVEVAGRLVGEDDRRARGERARHGDALLLAAGELARAGASSRSRGRRCRSAGRPRRVRRRGPRSTAAARCSPRASSTGSRLKDWKMKPTLSRRSSVRRLSSSVVSSTPSRRDACPSRPVEAGEDVHERRLARARRAHDRGERPRPETRSRRRRARARRPRPRRNRRSRTIGRC